MRTLAIQGCCLLYPWKPTPPALSLLLVLLRVTPDKRSVAKSCIHFCLLLSIFRPCCLKYQQASGEGLPQTVPVLACKPCILGNSSILGKLGQQITHQEEVGVCAHPSSVANPLGLKPCPSTSLTQDVGGQHVPSDFRTTHPCATPTWLLSSLSPDLGISRPLTQPWRHPTGIFLWGLKRVSMTFRLKCQL